MIQIEINARGGVAMLHDDAVNLAELGELEVWRASNVEYADGETLIFNHRDDAKIQSAMPPRGWYVQSAKTLVLLATGFGTRAEALAWEKTYYSPSGPGWTELTKES